jgi:hypothetical protein
MVHNHPILHAAVVAAITISCGLAQESTQPIGDGFLTGLQGFEKLHEPIGQPLYFESPTIETSLRPIYIRHTFDNQSQLQGGQVSIYAAQLRVALTDRLALIATKDGYSEIETGALGSDEGWNSLAGGLKYAMLVDEKEQMLVTTGIRYEAENGHRGTLQGGVDEFSPFVSAAKGFGDMHTIGNVTWRVPTDSTDGNQVLHWDLHFDYDLNPNSDRIVSPVAEVHGVHYLDGNASPLTVGGLDYTNLGTDVAGEFVAWAGLGLRMELDRKTEIGAVYEFALTDSEDDIMNRRVTVDMIFRW